MLVLLDERQRGGNHTIVPYARGARATVRSLAAKGMATTFHGANDGLHAVLTDAGRAALAGIKTEKAAVKS